jgi:acyl-ACP thioesterase
MIDTIEEVYGVHLIEIDEGEYVNDASYLHTVHKTYDGAEKELDKQIKRLLNKYKNKALQGYRVNETEGIINEFCFIRTEKLKD